MTDTKVIDRAAGDARDARGHRLVWVFIAMAVVGLVLLAVAFFSYRVSAAERDAERDRVIAALSSQADDNARDAQALKEQVESLGATPVVQPAQPGQRGANGADGRDGRDGADGSDGRDGVDGANGADGRDGADGEDGTDGQNGVDGQSPPCLTEPNQCRGADGQPGAQGEPGPTCPAGYTAQSRRYDPSPLIAGDEETWWVCVADQPGEGT